MTYTVKTAIYLFSPASALYAGIEIPGRGLAEVDSAFRVGNFLLKRKEGPLYIFHSGDRDSFQTGVKMALASEKVPEEITYSPFLGNNKLEQARKLTNSSGRLDFAALHELDPKLLTAISQEGVSFISQAARLGRRYASSSIVGVTDSDKVRLTYATLLSNPIGGSRDLKSRPLDGLLLELERYNSTGGVVRAKIAYDEMKPQQLNLLELKLNL